MKNKKLLLISNSVMSGQQYLDHCAKEIVSFLHGPKTVLFIPYALKNYDLYTKTVSRRFKKMKISLIAIHKFSNPKQAVKNAKAIFVGGGNTFRLLKVLYDKNLISDIKKSIENGTPYIGVSAGANIVCPTIKTTNDMPIVEPESLEALNLVSFQINPHYIDPGLASEHMGETRDMRIKEFHEENDIPVVGLREGAWLRIKDLKIMLGGINGAKIFKKGEDPIYYKSGSTLVF